jgi:hypothetical protein
MDRVIDSIELIVIVVGLSLFSYWYYKDKIL